MLVAMPQYEYRCNACKREFEYTQSMSDPDLVTCEGCGAGKLERLISWTAVRSNTWKAALYTDNAKEAMRGTHAVDLSKEHRFKGNETPAEPEPAVVPEPVVAPDGGDPPAS
jgi:putative FmdB family regulatory protein